MARKGGKLLIDYLEGVSWKLLEEYPEAIKELMGRRTGVYSLYRQDKLYYVGLASNLRGRVTTHLKDRHKGLWDRFSVYLTPNDDHMKDLESLILRVARPKGNKVKGGLRGASDLNRRLAKVMADRDADNRASLIGGRAARHRRRFKTSKKKGSRVLAGLVEHRVPLRGSIHKKMYRATLRKDGMVSFRGKLYKSPSSAASAITDRAMNGWWFWKFKEDGAWVRLDRLRR
jgi:hypothetical protein